MEIDSILNDATGDGVLDPEQIARQSGKNINQIESVLGIFSEHEAFQVEEVIQCQNEDCQVWTTVQNYEKAIEEDGECFCTSCEEKIQDNSEFTRTVYRFRLQTLSRTNLVVEHPESSTNTPEATIVALDNHEIEIIEALLNECLTSHEIVDNFLGNSETGRIIRDNVKVSGNLNTARRTIREEAIRQELIPDLLIDLIEEVPKKEQRLLNAATYVRSKLDQQSSYFARRINELTEKKGNAPKEFVNEKSSLEGIVSLDPFLRMDELRKWCDQAERRVCRVRIGKTEDDDFGTGFLIGEDLVLTCFHVVENAIKNPEKIFVHFDDTKELIGLATGWTIPHSRYGDADLVGGAGDPSQDELDFAVLKLAERAGSDRGFFPLGDYREPREGEPIIIAGHPGPGAPLQNLMFSMAAPGFERLNANETRMIYKTSTENGSSGSPVFDRSFRLVGLHHNGGDKADKKFLNNRGIPIDLILGHLNDEMPDVLDQQNF